MVADEVSGPVGLMACSSVETTLQTWLSLSLRRLGLERFASHHDRPGDTRHLIGERYGNQARRLPLEQSLNPSVVCRLLPIDDAKHRGGADHQKLAQIAIALLGDLAKPLLAAARVLPRHHTEPGGEMAS